MIIRVDIYGINSTDLKGVARILEKKFNIGFVAKNRSEMGGEYYDYAPGLDEDEHWVLHWTDHGDAIEREEMAEPFTDHPITLRVWNAPDMVDLRRKMTGIEEFAVILERWKVVDNETMQVIDEYNRAQAPNGGNENI